MKIKKTKTISIAGAGLAGTLLAVLLAQRGFKIDLFERNPDPRGAQAQGGRSINLAIGERGRHALRTAGLLEYVDRFTIPMRGRMMHDISGGLSFQPYGKDDSEVIYSAHRGKLNRLLLLAAEQTGSVRLHFSHQLVSVDRAAKRMQFLDPSSGNRIEHGFEVLVGADGGGSAVRRAMSEWFDIGTSEEILEHGYLELHIAARADGEFRMDSNALHIWPRGDFMMIALPNPDGSFTVTLFLSRGGDPGFANLQTWEDQRGFLVSHFPDAKMLLENPRRDFLENPVGLLGTVRCRRWHDEGRVVLLGDAAHAVVPFHGQGMNAAFEDCVAFLGCLENPDRHWREVFHDFESMRRDNANAIADMALENYAIMRESVRDPMFLLRKELEHELERRHPGHFIARYSLVMFHRVPYTECRHRGEIQAGILDQLLEGVETIEDIDYENAARLIGERLHPVIEPA